MSLRFKLESDDSQTRFKLELNGRCLTLTCACDASRRDREDPRAIECLPADYTVRGFAQQVRAAIAAATGPDS
ncbi:hypothetical protein Vse01_45150 [Micromonospora sediminimaris]|uniref:Uncharacterized protein n=1 Tax=Micromonospora sediminimaris TaxID=547162 RepID=A0A9W5UUK2_9ACTN|nr:hypothetical protein Vse01_45150 [Micromonospora sediminimaris]